MPSNLEALKALKISAEKQSKELENTIIEIHKQSLDRLEKDLTDIMNKKLNIIEKNINAKMEEIANKNLSAIKQNINEVMEEINERSKSEYGLKMMIFITIGTAIIFLLFGLILAPTL